MRIAIFTDSFFPAIGGTEKAVLGLANELIKNHEVAIFCPSYKKSEDNFPFKVFRCASLKCSDNVSVGLPRFSKKFSKSIKNFNPDVIHCQTVSGVANAGLRYGVKHNIPVIFTLHTKFSLAYLDSIKSKTLVNSYLKIIGKRLSKADLVCTVSNDMIPEINSYGFNGRIEVIKNGMVFKKQDLSETEKNLAKDKFNINSKKLNLLFVGRIVKVKNLDVIIKTLENLKAKNIDFQMIFVGSGPDLDHYKKIIEEKNLKENTIFTQNVEDNLLKSIYFNSDLFIFPSIFDNDPLVVVESALFFTPSIVLKNTGSAERIKNEQNGIIVNDEYEFINKVEELSYNKNFLKILGKDAYETIPKEWKTVAIEYSEIYDMVVRNKIDKNVAIACNYSK